MNLTKKDILDRIINNKEMQKKGYSNYNLKNILDIVLDEMGNLISDCNGGDKIEIRKFGTFTVYLKKVGEKRNPKTGEIIKCDPYLNCRFKLSKSLKKKLREGK